MSETSTGLRTASLGIYSRENGHPMSEDQPITQLRSILDSLGPGMIQGEDRRQIERLLADAWDLFPADHGGMEGYKVRGRTEQLTWSPPKLTFTIERHGGFVLGSTRAELQHWTLDLDNQSAGFETGYRQLIARAPVFKTGPVAEELAAKILAGTDDDRLRRSKDGRRVQVRMRAVLPAGAAKATQQGRSQRLRRDLAAILEPRGWRKASGGWWELPEPPDSGAAGGAA